MGQMADRRRHIIVFIAGQDQRNGAQGRDEIPVGAYLFGGNPGGWSENIIGVFQKERPGVQVAGALASRHGMSADELPVKAQRLNVAVNIRFDASHIRKEALGA